MLILLGQNYERSPFRMCCLFVAHPFFSPSLSKLMFYSGTIFELLAFIDDFLELMIVMVLASGWAVDLLLGLS